MFNTWLKRPEFTWGERKKSAEWLQISIWTHLNSTIRLGSSPLTSCSEVPQKTARVYRTIGPYDQEVGNCHANCCIWNADENKINDYLNAVSRYAYYNLNRQLLTRAQCAISSFHTFVQILFWDLFLYLNTKFKSQGNADKSKAIMSVSINKYWTI